jgi:hypothetical protein
MPRQNFLSKAAVKKCEIILVKFYRIWGEQMKERNNMYSSKIDNRMRFYKN